MKIYHKLTAIFLILFLTCTSSSSFAQKKSDNSKLIYVPVYSSIYYGDRDREFDLAITLSVRNIDKNSSITIHSVDYYNKSGKLVRSYLNTPKILGPYETAIFIVKESDSHGGSTASFLVRWSGDKNVNDLLVEAVMIGTQQQQGISFISRGIHIKN
jgi:hypothetical protein